MKRTLTIPLEVQSQNVTDRMHHLARHKLKRVWTHAIRYAVGHAERPDCRMAVTIEAFRIQRITDHANLVGGAKMVIDAIRDAGLIKDDSDRWMVAAYVQHVRSDPTNPMPGRACTRIVVEPFPEPTPATPATPANNEGTR